MEFQGPLGSFYLRPVQRPVLFLAGGTGLAPFLSMLDKLSQDGAEHPIHLIFGVTNDPDLIKVDELENYTKTVPGFSYACTVADESSSYPNKGYVTRDDAKSVEGFDRTFQSADANHDGKLTADEFKKAWTSFTGNPQ